MNHLFIARKALRDARVTAIGGGMLTFLLALMYVLIYPSIKDTFGQIELPEYMQEFAGAAGSYDTPAGYLATEFFSFVHIMLTIFAIVIMAGASLRFKKSLE